MWFTKLALKRPVTISMIFICALVMGASASRLLPLEFFPTNQFPGLFVQAPYPGSSPEEVEKEITKPLEEALATMGSIEQMQSFTSQDNTTVILLFNWGINAKLKGVEAREKIDAIKSQLPDDLRRVMIFTGSTNDQPIVSARLSADTDLSDSYELLNRQLKQRLERINGVSEVKIRGLAAKTYQIELLPERLAAFHIDSRQILNLLQNANSLVSAGEVKNDHEALRLTLNQQFGSLSDIRNLVINDRGLLLSDVAKVSYAKEDKQWGWRLNQKHAIGLDITREADANLVSTANAIVEELEKIEQLPDFSGVKLLVTEDLSESVVQSLGDIVESGTVGFVLSSLVLFAFLRNFRVTLIVSLAVPFSLLLTLAAMYVLDITLNILSMMGLMLAIGMLVDNAVVVSESIFGYRQKMPDKPIEATLKGVQDVGIPVIAGTLTTAIVFLPNIIGEKVDITMFISNVAVTIVISLLASLFIATTIIPLALSKMPLKQQATQALGKAKVQSRYSQFLRWMMRHPVYSALIVLVLLGSVVIPAKFVKLDLFPAEASSRLYFDYNIRGSYELEKVEKAVIKVEQYLYDNQQALDIESVLSWYGEDGAGSTLLLVDESQRTKTNKQIRELIEKQLPKLAIASPSFEQNRSGAAESLSIGINGEDTQTLIGLAADIAPVMETIKGVTRVLPGSRDGVQEVRVLLNAQRLNQLGLNPQMVASSISIALRKQQLKTFRSIYGEIDITLTFANQDKASLSDLAGLPIELPNPVDSGNSNVRLDSVATLQIMPSMPRITRFDRRTSVQLNIDYHDVTAEEVREATDKLMEKITLPTGYGWGYGRSTARETKMIEVMSLNMILAVLMIFIIMAALFESMMLPLSVVTSIVFAIVGVYWFFFITGTTMSMMAMIGILVLMGVVVNNGIVLVDRINHYRKEGVEKREAVLQAANDRIRPILMTVLTTILGLLPLSLGETQLGGEGPPYYPMARAVIGGLAYSTVATLICLPAIYLFLDYVREFFAQVWSSVGRKGTRWTFSNMRLGSKLKR
jgi:HAE1 family hydrophobic/amphiphilic exporter-1